MKRINKNRLVVQLEILCDIFSMSVAFLISLLISGIHIGFGVLDASYIYFGIAAEAVTVIILNMLDAYGCIGSYIVKKNTAFSYVWSCTVYKCGDNAFCWIHFL